MKPTEQKTWVTDYLGGLDLFSIAKKYAVPYWRVRNAVLWSDELAADSLRRYAAHVPTIRAALLANPKLPPDRNGLHIPPKAFRLVRYALILNNEIPNTSRYSRRITQQEETRIHQLAETPGQWRRLTQLAKTTGRGVSQQGYIARQILGDSVANYRRNYGYSVQGIAAVTGFPFGSLQKLIKRGAFPFPFTEDEFFKWLAAGGAMYRGLNHARPDYREIITFYRNQYRVKYISKQFIAQVTSTVKPAVTVTMQRNGIARELMLHGDCRICAYDRETVARYYTKRYGHRIAVQLREYDNDWLYLKCDWYTW